jgi:hypothetical protein
MSWPLSHDYNEAVQNPRLAFADPDLKAAQPVVGAGGLPLPRSGNFADVYQLRGADGRDWAVKCFTRPVVGLAERYARVSEALAREKFPFTVGFTFLDEGVRAAGAWRPAVKMDWVEGFLLNQVVRDNAGKPQVLAALLQMWARLARRLREAGIAHADLQHGNVLLVPGSRPGAYALRLIDYDGMYVPALANRPSGEVGHPSYQHPTRASGRVYSLDVDRFPHLVVATALKGLEVLGQPLWDRHDTGDNLLFTEDDFRAPHASKVMKELWRTENASVQAFVGRLAVACGRPIPQTPRLDQFAPDGVPTPLTTDERREAAAALGVALPVPVALPPEPGAVVPLPALPLPPAPTPADNLAFDFDDAPAPAPAARRAGDVPRSPLPLLIAAGVLLLVGGAVAGYVLFRDKPAPTDTASDDGGTDPKGSPPKPKSPDDVPPKPKDNQPGPGGGEVGGKKVDPIVLAPVGKLQPRERWRVELGKGNVIPEVVVAPDSKVAVLSANGKADTVDLETGKTLTSPPDSFQNGNSVVGLAGGRFASAMTRGANPIAVWDPRAGRVSETLKPVPFEPFGLAAISPDLRYVAGTRTTAGQAVPLRLKNAATDQVILDFEWDRGSVLFTADSSRVLVADGTGRFRWFELPSGEPDGEWSLRKEPPAGPAPPDRVVMSDDGSVILYEGRLEGSGERYHLLDGRTGRLIRSLPGPHAGRGGSLSGDGRMAAAMNTGPARAAEVIETATGEVVARVPLPPGSGYMRPHLLRDGSAVVAFVAGADGRALVRYDLLPEGVKPKDVVPKVSPDRPPGARWAAAVPGGRGVDRVHVDSGADLVAVAGPRGGFAAFDLGTGQPRDGFAGLEKTGVTAFFRADAGRLGTVSSAADAVRLWDAGTGRPAGDLPVSGIPPGAGNAKFLRACLAPDGRFLAVGRAGHPVADNPDVPFRVFDTAAHKALLSMDWKGGSAHFTADSARVLVAEWSGRCRWFKLPSGEADGEWDLGPPPAGRKHLVYGTSADGSVLAYNGPAGLKDGAQSPALLDGRSGKVVRHFREHLGVSELSLSADGARVALMRDLTADSCVIDVVDAASGNSLRRVTVVSGRWLPAFALAPDGRSLALFNPDTTLLVLYELPARNGP